MTHFENTRIRRLPDDEADNRQVIGGWRKHYSGRRPYVWGRTPPKVPSIQEHRAEREALAATIAERMAAVSRSRSS